MPATHPFAIKCERVLADLLRTEAAMIAAKAAGDTGDSNIPKDPGAWVDSLGRHRITTKIGGTKQLGAIARDTPEVTVTPGGALDMNVSKKLGGQGLKKPKTIHTGDPGFDALNNRWRQLDFACSLRNVEQNASYYRCVAAASHSLLYGSDPQAECKSLFVPKNCPEVQAALKDLDDYVKSKGPGWTPGGGQFGGGGASGHF